MFTISSFNRLTDILFNAPLIQTNVIYKIREVGAIILMVTLVLMILSYLFANFDVGLNLHPALEALLWLVPGAGIGLWAISQIESW